MPASLTRFPYTPIVSGSRQQFQVFKRKKIKTEESTHQRRRAWGLTRHTFLAILSALLALRVRVESFVTEDFSVRRQWGQEGDGRAGLGSHRWEAVLSNHRALSR